MPKCFFPPVIHFVRKGYAIKWSGEPPIAILAQKGLDREGQFVKLESELAFPLALGENRSLFGLNGLFSRRCPIYKTWPAEKAPLSFE